MRSADNLSRLKPSELEETNRLCRKFILASLLYFLAGSLLGVLYLLGWRAIPLFVHLHLNFFGWISMMIFGVGYKLLPNYAGKMVIHSLTMAKVQFWLSNLGFLGLLVFYVLWFKTGSASALGLAVAAAAAVVGSVALFGLNVWLTFRPEVASGEGRRPVHERGS